MSMPYVVTWALEDEQAVDKTGSRIHQIASCVFLAYKACTTFAYCYSWTSLTILAETMEKNDKAAKVMKE